MTLSSAPLQADDQSRSTRACIRIPGLLAIFLLAVGCRGEAPENPRGLDMELGISPTPPGVGPARLIITLKDSAGAPVSGALVTVEGNMSHAGMVPVVDTAQAQEPGFYLVDDFSFTMAGDWTLSVDVTLEDGSTASFQNSTGVVSAPPGLPVEPDTMVRMPSAHRPNAFGDSDRP